MSKEILKTNVDALNEIASLKQMNLQLVKANADLSKIILKLFEMTEPKEPEKDESPQERSEILEKYMTKDGCKISDWQLSQKGIDLIEGAMEEYAQQKLCGKQ